MPARKVNQGGVGVGSRMQRTTKLSCSKVSRKLDYPKRKVLGFVAMARTTSDLPILHIVSHWHLALCTLLKQLRK